MMTSVNDTVLTFEKIIEALGEDSKEFIAVMNIVQSIIDNPDDWTGAKAAKYATVLAAYRFKISMRAQACKKPGLAAGSPDRLKKDVLLAMYSAMEENINTLKLLGREQK